MGTHNTDSVLAYFQFSGPALAAERDVASLTVHSASSIHQKLFGTVCASEAEPSDLTAEQIISPQIKTNGDKRLTDDFSSFASPSFTFYPTSSLELSETHHALGHAHLGDDVDAVVDLLAPQDGMQVVEPILQVVVSVPKGDDDGHLLFGSTVQGCVFSSFCHIRVLSLYLLHGHLGAELNQKTAHCREQTHCFTYPC